MRFEIAHELPRRIRLRILDDFGHPDVVRRVHEALGAVPGVASAAVRPLSRTAVVEHDGRAPTREGLLACAARVDVRPAASRGDDEPDAGDELEQERRELVRAAVRWLAGGLLAGWPKTALAVHGWIPYLSRAVASARARRLDADVLDATAMAVAIRMGDQGTAGLISLLLRLGDYIRARTELRAQRDVASSLRRADVEAWVRRDGREVRVSRADLRPGDLVVVRSGHVVPVDGVVRAGRALVNQAAMTGESIPVARRRGTRVYEGTTVVDGRIEVEAIEVGDATRVAKIARMIDEAEAQKALVQGRAARLADRLVPWIFGAAGAAWLATGDFGRAASILLVDYSCALKLSVPISIKTGVIEALRGGVLVRGGKYLEALAGVDTVVFDKTGTLTEARPDVVGIVVLPGFERDALLRDTACVEEHFPHPVATAIVRQAAREGLLHDDETHGEVKHVVAQGIVSAVRGRRFIVGSRRFLERSGVRTDVPGTEGAAREGLTVVHVAVNGRLAGLFQLEDPIRREARETIARLRAMGVERLVLLTGDGEANARRVATLGIDEVHAEVSPEEKVRIVQGLRDAGRKVAMVGDGINDAPALAVADVGISFQHGADIAREAADVVLLRQDLLLLPGALALSRLVLRRVRRNFAQIVGVNSSLIAAASAGLVSPASSALLHNSTTLVTSLRSLGPYRSSTRP